jgi:scyllo-inositol 2-dehydrogenase (NADP+)
MVSLKSMTKSHLNIGICGFGASATYFHMPLIFNEPRLKTIAVFDPVVDRLEDAQKNGFEFIFHPDDLGKYIRELLLDIIIITSPNIFHFKQAKTALESGAHVLVDKPLGMCSQEVEILISLAHRQHLVLQVFQNRRYDDDHRQVLEIVRKGEIGEIIRIDASIASWGPSNKFAIPEFYPNWRTEKKYGGGGLYDWGPHILDQLLRFVEWKLPTLVYTIGRSSLWSSDCDDNLIAIYDWENCSARVLISSVDMAALERIRICGTQGTIVVRGDDNHGEIIKYKSTNSESLTYSNSVNLAAQIYTDLIFAITTGQHQKICDDLDNTKKIFELLDQTRHSLKS